jgi:hypothetical protein
MEGLGFQLRAEAVLQTLTEEVLKSSEIEGELLDKEQVRSSLARPLTCHCKVPPRGIRVRPFVLQPPRSVAEVNMSLVSSPYILHISI